MRRNLWVAASAASVLAAACAGPSSSPEPEAIAAAAPVCRPVERMPVAGRTSPYDSATVTLGGDVAKVCYGRPAARGRTVFGTLVPYDTLWRTGANEPTILHLPFAAELAGLPLQPGSYSLYTVPGANGWQVVVNRSTTQWGHEGSYSPEVRAQEVGRAPVPSTRTDGFVESFTIRGEPRGATAANLVLEWENTRVSLPLVRRG